MREVYLVIYYDFHDGPDAVSSIWDTREGADAECKRLQDVTSKAIKWGVKPVPLNVCAYPDIWN